MKNLWEVITLIIILIVAIVLALLYYSLVQSYGNLFRFSSNKIFLVSMFNIILYTILVRSVFSSSADDFDGYFASFSHSFDKYEELWKPEASDNSDGDEKYPTEISGDEDDSSDTDTDIDRNDSDGYFEDSDESGGADEIGWDDDDDDDATHDNNLESRIEDFIEKVNRGWRDEQLAEKLKIVAK